MDTPPETPKLFHQLKNAIKSTIAHWKSTTDLYRLGNSEPEDA